MAEVIYETSQEQPNASKDIRQKSRSNTIIYSLIGLIGLCFFIFMVIYIFSPDNKSKEAVRKVISNSKAVIFKPQNTPTPTPTPLPFEELTIPYLREKTFESKLGEMEEVFPGSNYTAYLTSYTSDGLKINALITKPNDAEPDSGFPAIVFMHGYIPPSQYETNGQAYSSYVDYLASNGFVVFKIDLRGHGSSEGRAGGGYFGADYVTDALNAIKALESTDFVDPNKIGMWGHSMSGNVIMRSWAVKRDMPAVVIWAGAVYSYTDMLKYRINDQSYRPPSNMSNQFNRRQRIYEKVGSPSATSVFWQRMAPTSYLDELKGAIQIHHAEDDEVVNIGYSRDLNKLLDDINLLHELYEYPTGGHNITDPSFGIAMERTVEFFKKYLK